MCRNIVIIDYDIGNVHSVYWALTFLGYKSVISRDPDTLRKADAYILPGVGAFGKAMINLEKFDLLELLDEEVLRKKKPFMGICLGMQILGNQSEESPGVEGLGWIDFNVETIPGGEDLKVPHVGWNTLSVVDRRDLFKRIEEEPHFYFDHGYYANCSLDFVVANCDYGITIPAIVAKENILGIQFHPEKSQTNGLKLFRNYFNYLGV